LYYFNLKTAKKLKRRVEERTSTIRQHEQKLIEMSKAKDKLYSIIAHDLKSPFNSLLGFSSLLRNDYDDFSEKEKKEFIHFIHHSSEELFALLENLLEWTRSSSDGIKYMPVIKDLNLIVEHTIQLQERNASEKKIALNNHIPKDTFVFADENMLRTIIRNLTSNAIKFTNAGGSISYLSQSYDSMVKCTVQDTGTGIAPEDLKHIFEIDSKIRKKGTANEGGTGLGLLLVKEFVEKNRGKLSVESLPGKGSAFSFQLPVG
jgi:signal transduction histidine kinase